MEKIVTPEPQQPRSKQLFAKARKGLIGIAAAATAGVIIGGAMGGGLLINEARADWQTRRQSTEIAAQSEESIATTEIVEGEPPVDSASQADQKYTVKEGDTLSEIAQRFNVSLEKLLELNPVYDPDQIQVGQVLVIPQP